MNRSNLIFAGVLLSADYLSSAFGQVQSVSINLKRDHELESRVYAEPTARAKPPKNAPPMQTRPIQGEPGPTSRTRHPATGVAGNAFASPPAAPADAGWCRSAEGQPRPSRPPVAPVATACSRGPETVYFSVSRRVASRMSMTARSRVRPAAFLLLMMSPSEAVSSSSLPSRIVVARERSDSNVRTP